MILASSSPRRRELLSLLGADFKVLTSEIDETVKPGESPKDFVKRLAQEKSRSVSMLPGADRVIIAADTAVVDGNQILGKPVNKEDALRMLHSLRGRVHHVLTGLAVWEPVARRMILDACLTEVHMRAYQESEMEAYVASGDPLDKAGAYAIQNSGFNPVQKISGCYANVVGLPLCHLTDILKELNLEVPIKASEGCRSVQGYDCQLIDQIQDFSSSQRTNPGSERK